MDHTENIYNEKMITLIKIEGGSSEQIAIKSPSLRGLRKVLVRIEDDPALIESLTGQPEGWADLYTDASILAAAQEVRLWLYPRLRGLVASSAAKAETLAPLATQMQGVSRALAKSSQTSV